MSAVAGGALAAAQTAPTASGPTPKWGAHLDLEGKIGNQRQLGEGDLFVPLLQNDRSMLFGNIKARMDDSTSTEGNFGLGVRHMFDGFNVGAYGYFDRRKATFNNYFNQVTVGAEILSTDWDLRANYYIPEGRRSHLVDSLNTVTLEGTTVVFRGGEERSLTGFDGELGYRVPVFKADDDKQWRVFAGAYRFYADEVNAVQGPRLRTELTFNEIPGLWDGSRLTWGGEFQDDVRGKTGFVTARLRIPLQVFGEGRKVASLTPMERRMTDPVVRDIDVVSRAGALGAPETVTQLANGNTFTVVNGAGFSAASLTASLTAAGANSTVVLNGTFATTATTTLQAGQTVTSGAMIVRSPSGRTATLSTSATLNIDFNGSGVAMANNSTISNLTITNSNSQANSIGVSSSGATGITIANNVITATTTTGVVASAVSLVGGSIGTVTGNTLSGNGTGLNSSALTITGGTTAVTVTGNTFSGRQNGAASTRTINLTNPVINAGSTGNTLVIGSCDGTVTSGSIGLANGATCPP